MLIGLGFLAFAITFHLFAARIAAGEGKPPVTTTALDRTRTRRQRVLGLMALVPTIKGA